MTGGGSGVPNGAAAETGGLGDPRQFSREVGARAQAAEELRRQLAAQGVDVAPLDATIAQLKQLQATTNPGKADALQAAIVAGLKEFEFDVWRKFSGLDLGNRPALGAAAQVPPEYRAMVEQYYRALARKGPN